MKSVGLTKENINAVAFKIATKKKRSEECMNHVIVFMIKNFPEKGELLGKIKVLSVGLKQARDIDPEMDVAEQIARNIFIVKGIDGRCFLENIITLVNDPSSFSRVFLLYFYKNHYLNVSDTETTLDAFSKLLLRRSGVEEKSCVEGGDVLSPETNEIAADTISNKSDVGGKHPGSIESGAVSLLFLEDIDEIKRVDASLSVLFRKKRKKLNGTELTICMKILDIMDVIVERNYMGDTRSVCSLLKASGHCPNISIFKRVFSVVKKILGKAKCKNKKELFGVFCSCLETNPDIIRMTRLMIDTCGCDFDWPSFLDTVEGNEDIDLSTVDRSHIPSFYFYAFLCRTENVGRFSRIAKSMIRSEMNIDALTEFRKHAETLQDTHWMAEIKNTILSRMKVLNKDFLEQHQR